MKKCKRYLCLILTLVLCVLTLPVNDVRADPLKEEAEIEASGDASIEEIPEESGDATFLLTIKTLGKGTTTLRAGDEEVCVGEVADSFVSYLEVKEGDTVSFYPEAEDGWVLAMAALSDADGRYFPIEGYADYDPDQPSESPLYIVGESDLNGLYQEGVPLSFEMTQDLTLFTDYSFRFQQIVREDYIGVMTSNESTTNFFARGDGQLFVSEEEMLLSGVKKPLVMRALLAAAAPATVTAGSLYSDTWTASQAVNGHAGVYYYTTNAGGKKADFSTSQSILTTLAKNYSRYLGTAYNNNGYATSYNGPWNCDGFVDRVLLDSGGDAINGTSGRWHTYIRSNHIESRTFYATSEAALMSALNDTKVSGLVPGTIIWFWDAAYVNAYNINSTMLSTGIASAVSDNHHIGIYIGNDLDTVLFNASSGPIHRSVEVAKGNAAKFWHSGPSPSKTTCKSSVTDAYGYPEENQTGIFGRSEKPLICGVFP